MNLHVQWKPSLEILLIASAALGGMTWRNVKTFSSGLENRFVHSTSAHSASI